MLKSGRTRKLRSSLTLKSFKCADTVASTIFKPPNQIKNKQLSVRQTEELVRKLYRTNGNAVKSSSKTNINEAYKRIEDNLATYFSTKVTLKHSSNGKGNITIEYYSQEELNKILELMQAQAY